MTTIEWTRREDGTTGETWNPIRARNKETGGVGHFCVKVSPGCKGCYAERLQPRYRNHVRYAAQDREKVEIFLDEEKLLAPLRWKRGRNIFPCSMTDLFADFVPDEWIDKVLAVAAIRPRHTFQALTKRADRMLAYFTRPDRRRRVEDAIINVLVETRVDRGPAEEIAGGLITNWPIANWWQGVSVEDQENANERIPLLMRAPVALRWISAEPLVERLDLATIKAPEGFYDLAYRDGPGLFDRQSKRISDARLDWIVVGGESGPKARTFDVAWAEAIIEQCRAARVPVFVKQIGRNARMIPDGMTVPIGISFKDSKGGDMTEWPESIRVRQYPTRKEVA